MLRILALAFAAALAVNAAAARTYEWPLCNGGEYGGFGYRIDPFTGRVAFHSGADMSGEIGETVRAARAGTVTAAESRDPYGLMIEIDHGGKHRTRYAHLSAFNVKPGQRVTQGQKIGEVGSSGRAERVHLHFEIWRNNVVADPSHLLPRNPKCSRRKPVPAVDAPLVDTPPDAQPTEAPTESRKPSNEELYATRFAWPVCSKITRDFGYHMSDGDEPKFHAGSDFGGGPGLPVRAAAAGVIITAEPRGKNGLSIEIEHSPQFRTRYAQLGSLRVKPGERVGRGQTIATTGDIALHFEIWLNKVIRPPHTYLEPESTCAD